jgi:hypothetical protein
MKKFFTNLMARLAGTNRTPDAGQADWHGRPLGERTLASTNSSNCLERDHYDTLRLTSSSEVHGEAAHRPVDGDTLLDTRASCAERLPASR